ncbi:MAG: hypothetical protein EA394_00955 [Bacteroidia bacterium]|nr:MAG: hypothetical protein EA394_00955 [Bacteroidia bacterium]
MESRKLRVGILVQGETVPAWGYHIIQEIIASKHLELALIIRIPDAGCKKRPFFSRLRHAIAHSLFSFHMAFERLLFRPKPNAFAAMNPEPLLRGIPEFVPETLSGSGMSDISLPVEALKHLPPDVIVQLYPGAVYARLAGFVRCGLWAVGSHCAGGDHDGLAGVWELLRRHDVTAATIHIRQNDKSDRPVVLKSVFRTMENSIRWNRNTYYWKVSVLMVQKLVELSRTGWGAFFERAVSQGYKNQISAQVPSEKPGNLRMAVLVMQLIFSYLRKKIDRFFFFYQWILLFKKGQGDDPDEQPGLSQRLYPPKDRLWADPFVIHKDNKYYVFYEEMLFGEKKGRIACKVFDGEENIRDAGVVLALEGHLSYPFVFEDGGMFYMIPENSAGRAIDLYRSDKFPGQWEPAGRIMGDVEAADATVFKHKGTYWLFVNIRSHPGVSINDDVFLFYSDRLLDGQWHPHPQNPVVSDVRFSRPAGKLFMRDGRVYRPAQNGGKHYGYGVQIMEVERLDKTRYSETPVNSILPLWAPDVRGIHTLNASKGFTVADALVKRKRR